MSKSETQTQKPPSRVGKLLARFTVGTYCPETGRTFQYTEDDLTCSECGSDLVQKAALGGATYGHK